MHVAITGASSGIGAALARAYLDRGASVTLVARRAHQLRALASLASDRTHVVVADLSQVDGATDWLEAAEAALGPIDVLVNNAGASLVHPTIDTDWAQAESLLRLNVHTPLKLTCEMTKRMVARGSGCIVDVASAAGLAPLPGFYFYNASKAGLAAASESLRRELAPHGVHVVTVYPGPVDTPMANANFAVFDTRVARMSPTGTPEVLARKIIAAVARKRARVIYPSVYGLARWFPAVARWFSDRAAPAMHKPRTTLAFEDPVSGGSDQA